MKVLLLAGGFGTRFSEQTNNVPKPMIEIGGQPILWHIMKIYAEHGFDDFVVLLGYKGHVIKEYFINYFMYNNDISINLGNNQIEILNNKSENWKITLLETGLHTMTGGRILRAKEIVGNETFMLTYGDGVGNVDITGLLEFHKSHPGSVTMTTVQPEGRFGGVAFGQENGNIKSFIEKPIGDGGWINAGFFVCEPKIFDYIAGDSSVWEKESLENLANEGELFAFKHYGFWKPMDTLHDNIKLNEMWNKDKALWKIW